MLYGTSCNNHYRSSYAFLLLLFLRRPENNQVQSGSVLKYYPGDTEMLCCVLLLDLQTKVREDFKITEKAPSRTFSWLQVPHGIMGRRFRD